MMRGRTSTRWCCVCHFGCAASTATCVLVAWSSLLSIESVALADSRTLRGVHSLAVVAVGGDDGVSSAKVSSASAGIGRRGGSLPIDNTARVKDVLANLSVNSQCLRRARQDPCPHSRRTCQRALCTAQSRTPGRPLRSRGRSPAARTLPRALSFTPQALDHQYLSHLHGAYECVVLEQSYRRTRA